MLDCFECLLPSFSANLNTGFWNRSNDDAVFACTRSLGNLLNERNEIIERTSGQSFCAKENLCVSDQLIHQNQARTTFVEEVLQVLRTGSYTLQICVTDIFCIQLRLTGRGHKLICHFAPNCADTISRKVCRLFPTRGVKCSANQNCNIRTRKFF